MSSQDAYDSLIQPHIEQMMRSIWRIAQNADDAEEAMQRAAAKIYENLDGILGHANPRALLLRISIHAACDVKRDRAKWPTLGDAVESIEAATEPMASLDDRERLTLAISRLPTRQATAVSLRYLLEESYADIAAALDCSEATARVHAARGLEKLRQSLRHETSGRTK